MVGNNEQSLTTDEIVNVTVLPRKGHNMNIQDVNTETEHNLNVSMNLDDLTEYKNDIVDKATSVSSEPGLESTKNNFRCKQCEFIGWSGCSLINHNAKEHNNRYKCDFCEFRGSKKFLRFHIKKEHSSHNCQDEKTKYFKCQLCKYSTFYKCYLTRHYKDSHKELDMLLKEDKNVLLDKSQDLRLKIEEYRLKEAISLNLNKIEQTKSESERLLEIKSSIRNSITNSNLASSVICINNRKQNIYYCCLCKYKGLRLSLKQHFSNKHENESFICECCTFQAATCTLSSKHTRNKHKISVWMHCQLCMFKTREETPFFTHFRRKHWNSKRYFCKVCKFNTLIKSDLNIHLKEEHPSVPNEFKCQLCNFYTVEMEDYEKHMMIDHAKIEHLKCEFCFYRTRLKLDLMQHIRDKHIRDNVESTEDIVQPIQLKENKPINREPNTKPECILVDDEIDLKSEIPQQDVINSDKKENFKFYTEGNSSSKVKLNNDDKKYIFNNIENENMKVDLSNENEIHDSYYIELPQNKIDIQYTEFPDTTFDISYLGAIKTEFETAVESQDDNEFLKYSESSKDNIGNDNISNSKIENVKSSGTEVMVSIKKELDDLFNENMKTCNIVVETKGAESYQLGTLMSNEEKAISNEMCLNE